MHYSIVVCVYRYILFTYVHCIGVHADLVQLLEARRMDAVRRQSLSRRGVRVFVCVCLCVRLSVSFLSVTHTCVYLFVFIYMFRCVYVCVCVCVCARARVLCLYWFDNGPSDYCRYCYHLY
jgi:hypothetical protein